MPPPEAGTGFSDRAWNRAAFVHAFGVVDTSGTIYNTRTHPWLRA
jgi:hypothetical protein